MRRFASALVIAALLPCGSVSALSKVEEQDLIVQCAACHGADGVAKDSEVPHIACQQSRYLYNQLQAFRQGKRPHKEMRYMGRRMTSADMDAIADYYASLPCR
jgi:cytochrome c553